MAPAFGVAARSAFLDGGGALVGVDIPSLPEVIVTVEGQDLHYRVFGDMLVSPEEQKARAFSGRTWPNGRVVFAFDPAIAQDLRQRFVAACHLWMNKTSLTCVERSSESPYVLVKSVPLSGQVAGQSVLGMPRSVGVMLLSDWSQKTLVHEIGHMIGKAHEHQRSDAKTYLDVHLENTDGSDMVKYKLVPTATRNYMGIDFDSIMFYWTDAFSANGKPTIVLKDQYKQYQNTIGRTDHPSDADLQDVVDAYKKP
jgi:hypothetical protein